MNNDNNINIVINNNDNIVCTYCREVGNKSSL